MRTIATSASAALRFMGIVPSGDHRESEVVADRCSVLGADRSDEATGVEGRAVDALHQDVVVELLDVLRKDVLDGQLEPGIGPESGGEGRIDHEGWVDEGLQGRR